MRVKNFLFGLLGPILTIPLENGNTTGNCNLINLTGCKTSFTWIIVEVLARQVQFLSDQMRSSNEELQLLRDRLQPQERSTGNLVFHPFYSIQQEIIFQKKFGDIMEEYEIKMSDVTSNAKKGYI